MLRMLWGVVVLLAVSVGGCSGKSGQSTSPADRPSVATPDDQETSVAQVPAAQQKQSTGNDTANVEESAAPPSPAQVPSPESPDSTTSSDKSSQVGPGLDPAMRKQFDHWLEEMASDANVERRTASVALDEQGQAAMPYIVAALQSGSNRQKVGAATYLIGRVGPRDKQAVVALIAALNSKDTELQRVALQAAERLPEEQLRQALPALQSLVQEPAVGAAYRSRAVPHDGQVGGRRSRGDAHSGRTGSERR